MSKLYYEDFPEGEVLRFKAGQSATRAQIIAFAEQFDPQPFHLSEAGGRASLLGGHAASGWHTGALTMRASDDQWISRTASLGMLGVDEARWSLPLRPDEILHFTRTTLDKRLSPERPDMGVVSFETVARNENGEHVFYQRHRHLIAARNADLASIRPPARPDNMAAPPALSTSEDFLEFVGFFEDYQIGQNFVAGATRFEPAAIVAFAQQFDPQPIHLDEAEARKRHFRGLTVAGWHIAACWMGNLIRWRQRHAEFLRERGVTPAVDGPSPGFSDMKWIKPVCADDVVVYNSRMLAKRATSRPGWGLISSHNCGTNQWGELVFEFRGAHFAPMRST